LRLLAAAIGRHGHEHFLRRSPTLRFRPAG
jgi:hypothetical protein